MHLYLVPGLRMSGAVPMLPLYAFMVWTEKNLPWLCVCHERTLGHNLSWTRFLLSAQSLPLIPPNSAFTITMEHLPLRYWQFGNLWLEHEATLACLMEGQACPGTESWEHVKTTYREKQKCTKQKIKKSWKVCMMPNFLQILNLKGWDSQQQRGSNYTVMWSSSARNFL